MAKKHFKTNAIRELEEKNISVKLYEYPHKDGPVDGVNAAKLIGKDLKECYKTLVTKANSGQIYIYVIPVADQLDLKKSAKVAGEKRVEMLDIKDITKVTGYVRGGCSPVAMKKQYRTFIDKSAKNQKSIVVSAGKIGFQIELNPDDLLKVIGASYEDITLNE